MNNELQNKLWKVLDNLRGYVGGWDIKPYILGALFIKKLYPKGLSIHALPHILPQLEKEFPRILEDFDLDSRKIGETPEQRIEFIDKLFKLINEIDVEELDFGAAYEYLLTVFNLSAAKSGGEFYTPPCIAELLARIVKPQPGSTIYDPTCGCGGLLVAANNKCELYGQELNSVAYNTCRMNLIANDYYNVENIKLGDTLGNPQHLEMKFDYVLANPPYSINWDQQGLKDDVRFNKCALAPKSKGDYAFILHSLHQIKEEGKAVIVVFPGCMYRGASEQQIRKYLVDNGFVEAIVQLTDNVFYGTSIATCLLILSYNNKDTLFVDGSNLFTKKKKKNILEDQHIELIADIVNNRKELDYLSKIESVDTIASNDYNLSVSCYVDKEDTREEIDIEALEAELKAIRARREVLEREIDEMVKELKGEE